MKGLVAQHAGLRIQHPEGICVIANMEPQHASKDQTSDVQGGVVVVRIYGKMQKLKLIKQAGCVIRWE